MASTSENNMKIEQVKTAPHEKRVATHTHIKGLGLRPDGTAEPIQSGFVGQENAREVLYSIWTLCLKLLYLLDLIRQVALSWR